MRRRRLPEAGGAERIRERMGEVRVWWVRLHPPVERLFCDARSVPSIIGADASMAWAGLGAGHAPRTVPTDREGVWCMEFAAPLETMAVEHDWMGPLMGVLRANGCHGHYREAGTEREYEF